MDTWDDGAVKNARCLEATYAKGEKDQSQATDEEKTIAVVRSRSRENV